MSTINFGNFDYEVFEKIKHSLDDDVEFWYASELAEVLGYSSAHNYLHFRETALKNAMAYCPSSLIHSNFREVLIPTSSGQKRKDYELTKYACRQVAMAMDESKPLAKLARSYFCYTAEYTENDKMEKGTYNDRTTYEERCTRRDITRESMKEMNDLLDADGLSKAYVHNGRYEGAYGGRTAAQVKEYKNLPPNARLLDTMGPLELSGNEMINSLTAFQLRNGGDVSNTQMAHDLNVQNGQIIRNLLIDRVGVKMEDLPPQPNIYTEKARKEYEDKERISGTLYIFNPDNLPKELISPFTIIAEAQ